MNKAFRRKLYMGLAELRGTSTTQFAPHGVTVTIPPRVDDNIRYQLTRGRSYEVPEGRFVKDVLRSGQKVVELGGSLGVVSALIRSVIGPSAKHVIVEANDALVEVCRANATQGADEGATEIVVAAIDYSGNPTVTFDTGSGAHVGAVSSSGGSMTVKAMTLSEVLTEMEDGPFALICDIEGMEADMIDREADILPRVSVFILETHPHAYPDGTATVDRIVQTCEQAGLQLHAQNDDVLCFVRPD